MNLFSSLFQRHSIVKQIPIFSKLNWFDMQRIARKSVVIEYRKGEMICREGMPPDAFYCLISGRVQAYSTGVGGGKQDIDFIRRGMHFGIISLLTGENHSHTYEAINDSLVLRIKKKDFQALLNDVPQLGVEFSQSLSRRVRRSGEKSKLAVESQIITIYSPVVGTGSSTYAVNLALNLAKESQKKVILVNISSVRKEEDKKKTELDEASPHWKRNAAHLSEILDNDEKIKQNIASGDLPIDTLVVNFDPSDPSLAKRISHFASSLTHDYPYVLVDLPNHMDEVVFETLTQSDLIHLVTLDSPDDLKMTRGVINHLEERLKDKFNVDRLQIIISGRQQACYLSFEEVNKEIDYHVYVKLPHIDRSELNVAAVSENMSVITPHPDSDYSRAVRRIARTIARVLVGLVLGGGAALGVAHIGVIRVLEEENIPIDYVIGSSMGALVGAFWVTGRNADGLEELAREFQSTKGMVRLFDPVFPKSGLIGGRLIKRWLKKRGLGNKTFYSTSVPLKIIAYDLIRREEIVIGTGGLADAVRKSVAIPGVIEPIVEKDQVIIDGGVLNPLPTNVLVSLGVNKIIAINVLQTPEHVTRGHEMECVHVMKEAAVPFTKNPLHYIRFRIGRFFSRAISPNIPDIIVRTLQASEYVIAEQSAQQADVVIHPDLTGINWFELYKVDELLEKGELAARQALPAIKQLIKET